MVPGLPIFDLVADGVGEVFERRFRVEILLQGLKCDQPLLRCGWRGSLDQAVYSTGNAGKIDVFVGGEGKLSDFT